MSGWAFDTGYLARRAHKELALVFCSMAFPFALIVALRRSFRSDVWSDMDVLLRLDMFNRDRDFGLFCPMAMPLGLLLTHHGYEKVDYQQTEHWALQA